MDYIDFNSPYWNDTSLAVTIPKKGLEKNGIDPEDLAGRELPVRLDGSTITIELPSDDATEVPLGDDS